MRHFRTYAHNVFSLFIKFGGPPKLTPSPPPPPLDPPLPGGRGGGSSLLYISVEYHMQKGGRGPRYQIAYVLNGRPVNEKRDYIVLKSTFM